MTLPENLDVYISALMFVLGAYFIALYIGMIVWTFRDIRSRSRDLLAQIMATLLVAIFTLPGLLIYMLLRPHVTLSEQYERSLTEEAILQDLNDQRVCPSCQHVVEPDFVVCPYCQTQLKLKCTGCGRLINPDWSLCPYCGLIQQQVAQDTDDPDKAETDEPQAVEVIDLLADDQEAMDEPAGNETVDGADALVEPAFEIPAWPEPSLDDKAPDDESDDDTPDEYA